MFHTAQDAKTYVLAGHATVTLTSARTGKWYTYKITQAKDRETDEPKDLWFVGLLAGPDNTADYTYIGILNGAGFRTTKGSKLPADAKSVRGFDYFWRHLEAGEIPADLEVRHENTCGRCGRALTVPESIDLGIGPECRGKMGGL